MGLYTRYNLESSFIKGKSQRRILSQMTIIDQATTGQIAAGASSRPSVLVVGGGLAGLTASKYLVDAGFQVTLLEKRPILGGKVSAWQDAEGDWIETGLHAFFGAYEEIYKLMRELDTYQHISWKKHELRYTLAGGEQFAFKTVNL